MNVQQRNKIDHGISVAVSCVINIGLVLAMLHFITGGPEQMQDLNTTLIIDPAEDQIIDEFEEEIIREEIELEDMPELDFQTDFNVDIETDFTPEQEPVEAPNDMSNLNQLTELLSDISSPVQMTSLMSGRTQLARSTMVGRFGGRQGSVGQVSVSKALKWLKDHQLGNGSWTATGEPGNGSPGYTGLALLAFLSHGETPASAEYGQTVSKAMRWLVEAQNANGSYRDVYAHAMATYALAESYSVTKNVMLREPLIKAVDVIVKGMQPTGGFDYGYRSDRDRNDSSVGGWQVQALKAATIAFPEEQRYERALQLAMDGMLLNSRASDNQRTIGYTSPGGGNLNITAAGALGMVFSGRVRDSATRELINSVQQADTTWASARTPVYQWYYVGQALFQFNPEGRAFRTFNEGMSRELIANQNADGSWDENNGNGVRGRSGTTALASMNLMVYYRHLPTGMVDTTPRQPPSATPGFEDDDLIRITL